MVIIMIIVSVLFLSFISYTVHMKSYLELQDLYKDYTPMSAEELLLIDSKCDHENDLIAKTAVKEAQKESK